MTLITLLDVSYVDTRGAKDTVVPGNYSHAVIDVACQESGGCSAALAFICHRRRLHLDLH